MATVATLPTSSSDRRTAVLSLVLLAAVQLSLLIWARRPIIYLLTIGGLASFVYLLSGRAIEKLLLLTVAIACLQVHENWNDSLRLYALPALLAGFLLIAQSVVRPSVSVQQSAANLPKSLTTFRLSPLEALILSLVGIALIQAFSGISQGHPVWDVVSELTYYLFFLIAIVAYRNPLSRTGTRQLFILIIAVTLFICLSYLRVFVATAGTKRPANLQQHMLNLGIPLLAAFYFRESRRLPKLLFSILLAIAAAGTYVTLTRALWIYVPLSLIILGVMLVRHKHITLPVNTILAAGLMVIALLAVNRFQAERAAARKGTELSARAETLRSLGQDLSILARIDLAQQTLRQWRQHPILGTGLGGAVRYRIFTGDLNRFHHLDSSYLTVLWKLGLVGLAVFVALYVIFLQRTWYVYRHTTDTFQLLVAAGTFAAFVSLVIIGIESGILAIYRFNLVWASLMGIFERWYYEMKNPTSVRP